MINHNNHSNSEHIDSPNNSNTPEGSNSQNSNHANNQYQASKLHSNPPNHLISSKSPYLQQHAYNPVEWFQWSETAWNKAKQENKLVLISIGYSTCHWCHVMEHESFEDHETAEIMNIGLVNIKVDREERPDIDMVYMDACQLMTGRGGWPLNVICLPDGRPVYAGTYFQKPQWQQLILQLTSQYRSQPESFTEYAQKFMGELQKMNQVSAPNGKIIDFSKKMALDIFQNYATDIDWEHGAKQRAPKFMVPIQFEYALDFHLCTRIPEAKEYMHLSLLKMANGGIYDSVRGGFFRYSTDNKWFAPHFEKMLYDNAQLMSLYSRAYAWSKADIYKTVVQQTIDFCDRELNTKPELSTNPELSNSPSPGYFSGLDADSEGIEGKFYTFTMNEIEQGYNHQDAQISFSADEIQFLKTTSNFTAEGNWEHGMNIVHTAKAPLQVIEEMKITAETYWNLKQSVSTKLFQMQESRIRPSLDYKVICSWNGLMLKALADAGFYLQQPEYTQKAKNLAETLWNTFWNPETQTLNRIYSTGAEGSGSGSTYNDGFLEDYSSLALGYIQLFNTTGNNIYLERAKTLLDRSIDLFYNPNTHQFEFVGKTSETLIIQKTDLTDDVIPAANSLLAKALNNLHLHYSDFRYRELYLELLGTVNASVNQHPGWYSGWAQLYLMESFEHSHVAVHQKSMPDADQIAHWPSWITVLASQENTKATWLKMNDQQPNGFYLCVGNRCLEPVSDWSQIEEILEDMYSLNESFENEND